jgi:hypothetical protein
MFENQVQARRAGNKALAPTAAAPAGAAPPARATTFPESGRVGVLDVTDGTSNTIFVIEAGTAVPWTKPGDLPYDPKKPLPKLGGVFPHVIHAAFVDTSVHTLRKDFKESVLRAAITRDDGQRMDWTGLQEPIERLRAREAEAAGGKPAAPGGEGEDAENLRHDNDRLRQEVETTAKAVVEERAELARLQSWAASGTDADADARRLAEEHARLKESLAREQAELKKLREQIAQVRKRWHK